MGAGAGAVVALEAQKPTLLSVALGGSVLFHSTPLSTRSAPFCFQVAFHNCPTVPVTLSVPLQVTASALGLVTVTVAQ